MDLWQSLKNQVSAHIGFPYSKYWKWREKYFSPHTNVLVRGYLVFRMRRLEYREGASIALPSRKDGNNFASPPKLGHGFFGIIIAGGARIGKDCFLSHQVTIGRSRGQAPTIGDNVYIGPGAKIFGGIHVGNNVRIGANCVVFEDVPDNATIALPKPRTIVKEKEYSYFVYRPDEMREERII